MPIRWFSFGFGSNGVHAVGTGGMMVSALGSLLNT